MQTKINQIKIKTNQMKMNEIKMILNDPKIKDHFFYN